jgi:RNA polymerase sigma factor for flagellar operon FliA
VTEKEKAAAEYSCLIRLLAFRLSCRLPYHFSAELLVSAGNLGLMDALEKYKPDKEIPFGQYAKIRIKGAMLDEIRSMDLVPRSLRRKSKVLEDACMALERRLGRDPSEEEIACELNLSMDEFYELLDEIKGISFVPENIEDHMPWSGAGEPFGAAYWEEIRRHLAEAIAHLPEKEQLVLSLYYYEELTMQEIGMAMGYTESRISQIHTKAMLKLRIRLGRTLKADDLPMRLTKKTA